MLKRHSRQTAHVVIPKETPAFFRAKCNEVSVNAELLCEQRAIPKP